METPDESEKESGDPRSMIVYYFSIGFIVAFYFLLSFLFSGMEETSQKNNADKVTLGQRKGQYVRHLGNISSDLTDQEQARKMLKILEQYPKKNEYYLSYNTQEDTAYFFCYLNREVIIRIYRPVKRGDRTQETWNGYVLERLNNAANGGSLNDTPEGKILPIFKRF